MINQFANIKAVVFDLDGTVYAGENLVAGALESINHVRSQGLEVYFCTNNSTRTRQEIVEKLKKLGIKTLSSAVYSAGYAAAHYLVAKGFKYVSLLGTKGLRHELQSLGLTIVNPLEKGEALVVGLDPEISYSKMASFVPLRGKSIHIVACNRDKWFPDTNGALQPGCGIIVDVVEALLERTVDIVVGKPNVLLLETLSQQSGLTKDELLVVGDSVESDVAVAEAFGSPWLLYAPGSDRNHRNNVIANMSEIHRMFT